MRHCTVARRLLAYHDTLPCSQSLPVCDLCSIVVLSSAYAARTARVFADRPNRVSVGAHFRLVRTRRLCVATGCHHGVLPPRSQLLVEECDRAEVRVWEMLLYSDGRRRLSAMPQPLLVYCWYFPCLTALCVPSIEPHCLGRCVRFCAPSSLWG